MDYFLKELKVGERLKKLAQAHGKSLAQMAIAWVLRDPRVTSALVGASSVAQLEDSLTALDGLGFDASREGFSGSVFTLTENQDLAIDLLRDALVSPRFEDGALKRVRDDMGLTNVWVMVPFVRTVEEGRQVVELLMKL